NMSKSGDDGGAAHGGPAGAGATIGTAAGPAPGAAAARSLAIAAQALQHKASAVQAARIARSEEGGMCR
ncbi:MAG TPA: hypothetical protein VGR40_06620, partial [Candidatus Binatus sp.]|nr:hypothetical protein [Candidatus Binatus sp.]